MVCSISRHSISFSPPPSYAMAGLGPSAGGKGSVSNRLVCRNRAAGRFSAPRGEITLLLPPRHSYTSTRARRHGEPRGIGRGCEIHSAREEGRDTDCIEYKASARRFGPWSPPQEGARDQSSSGRRGLPSKGEARALHHQPAPALTLTMPCLLLSRRSTRWRNASTISKNHS